MMKAHYQQRDVNVIEFSNLNNEILRPETVMLQFDPEIKPKPVDIGSLCYRDRQEIIAGWDSNKRVNPRAVILNSLMPERRDFIRSFLDSMRVSGKSHVSLFGHFRYIRYVFDWIDTNSFSDFLESYEMFSDAYAAFTDHVFHRIHGDNTWNPGTAARYQSAFWFISDTVFDPAKTLEIKSSRPIVHVPRQRVHAPSTKEVVEYVSYLSSFVRGLKVALMNDDFPLKIPCSNYEVVIYPSNNKSVSSPYVKDTHAMFDTETHQMLSFNEYKKNIHKKREKSNKPSAKKVSASTRDYKRSVQFYIDSNKDKKGSRYRKSWAQKVIRGYATLIQFITGANPSSLVAFEYSNALDVASDSVQKDLLSIKLRANGSLEKYPIGGNKGLRILKEYLDFRDWYLNERSYKYLFFTDIDSSGEATECVPIRSDFQSRLYKQLCGRVIPKHIENITPSMARKHKNIILKRLGLTTGEAAQSLNHSEEVNDQSYSAPSQDEMIKEFSSFWTSVKAAANNVNIEKKSSDSDTIMGHCDDFGNPETIASDVPIKPSCRTQLGCLFCEHYACHADEEDIRKILSLRYVINEVREYAIDYERADFLFKEISIQVGEILKRIEALYPGLSETIERINKEVYDLGLLTPFWASRLDRYEKMGLVL